MVLSLPSPAAAQVPISSPQSSRLSLAIASDPERALRLSPTFQPDVDLLASEGTPRAFCSIVVMMWPGPFLIGASVRC